MTTRVTNLSRLSRNKTTGNLIIGLVLVLESVLIIYGFTTGLTTQNNALIFDILEGDLPSTEPLKTDYSQKKVN